MTNPMRSQIFFHVPLCMYLDGYLDKHRLRVGYYIGNIFIGAPAYADDIVLSSLTATATRLTFGICYHFALDYSILFHANKCKCISVDQCYGYSISKKNLRTFSKRFFC